MLLMPRDGAIIFADLIGKLDVLADGGNPASMAAIVYRAQCVSANSR
jgi:hypothetical protein